MKSLIRSFGLLAALVVVLAACGGSSDDETTTTAGDETTTTQGDAGATTTTGGDTATTQGDAGATTTQAAVNNGDDVADTGETVAVFYTGTLDDGTEFDSNVGGEALVFVLDAGQMIPGFNDAVLGMTVGDSVTVSLAPGEAYGEVDPELVIEYPIDEVPDVPEEGAFVQAENGARGLVTEVTDEMVTVDWNHELAGQELTFEIELSEIR